MNGRKQQKNAGIGVGYITVMIIFAILCLTVFAVLSFRAAGSNDALNDRAGNYLKNYYAADMSAKEILSRLDEIAFELKGSAFFAESFEEEAKTIEGVSVKSLPNGCTAEYSVGINNRQSIFASVIFFENGEFKINEWKSITNDTFEDDPGLNVWDGTF